MVGLQATGELTYNSYTFDGASHVTVAIEYVYDEADRTIVAQKHIITVRAIVAASGGIDGDLETIRQKLGQRGGHLKLVNKGFGDDLNVKGYNGVGGIIGEIPDIRDGPKPKVLSWEPVGDDKAAEIVWTVETHIALCLGKKARSLGVSALNYSASYAINMGLTTRTLTGYLEIVSKVGGNDSADRYREFFGAATILGFKRDQTWTTSADQSRLDFTITDTEIDSNNAYPQDVTDISGTHRFSYRIGGQGITRSNSIGIKVSPRAGISGGQAWLIFKQLVDIRVQHAKSRGQTVFFEGLDVEESLYGRSHTLSIRYRLLKPTKNLIGDTGLWKRLPGSWNRWAASLSGTAFNFRGNPKLRDIGSDHIVIDLCEPFERVYPNNSTQQQQAGELVPGGGLGSTFRNTEPGKDSSYVYRHDVVVPTRSHSTSRQQILQSPIEEDTNFDDLYLQQNQQTDPSWEPDSSVEKADVVHEDTGPGHSVKYLGRARRVGHPIPRPAVVTVGGKKAYPKNATFAQVIIGKMFGISVYEAAWSLDYILEKSPGVIPVPPDKAAAGGDE